MEIIANGGSFLEGFEDGALSKISFLKIQTQIYKMCIRDSNSDIRELFVFYEDEDNDNFDDIVRIYNSMVLSLIHILYNRQQSGVKSIGN